MSGKSESFDECTHVSVFINGNVDMTKKILTQLTSSAERTKFCELIGADSVPTVALIDSNELLPYFQKWIDAGHDLGELVHIMMIELKKANFRSVDDRLKSVEARKLPSPDTTLFKWGITTAKIGILLSILKPEDIPIFGHFVGLSRAQAGAAGSNRYALHEPFSRFIDSRGATVQELVTFMKCDLGLVWQLDETFPELRFIKTTKPLLKVENPLEQSGYGGVWNIAAVVAEQQQLLIEPTVRRFFDPKTADKRMLGAKFLLLSHFEAMESPTKLVDFCRAMKLVFTDDQLRLYVKNPTSDDAIERLISQLFPSVWGDTLMTQFTENVRTMDESAGKILDDWRNDRNKRVEKHLKKSANLN